MQIFRDSPNRAPKSQKHKSLKQDHRSGSTKRTKFNRLTLTAASFDRPKLKFKKASLKRKLKKGMMWIDKESPYAEFLPALYREWAPKEPKGQGKPVSFSKLISV